MSALANMIKELRERKGLTQSQLGELVGGKSYQLVQRWESGRGKPTTEQLPLIASALDISIAELVTLATQNPESAPVQLSVPVPPRKPVARSVDITYLEEPAKAFPVRADLIKPGVPYAVVTVADRGMEPQLRKGSVLLVKQIDSSEIPYETDGVYAVRGSDRLLVRRVQANNLRTEQCLTLFSDNGAYESVTLKSDQIEGMWQVLSIVDQPVH